MTPRQITAQIHPTIILLCTLGLLTLLSMPGSAEPPKQEAQVQQALEKLRARIKTLNAQISAAQSTKTKLEESLKDTEMAIGQASQELHRLKHALQAKQARIQALREQQRSEGQDLRSQRDRLGRQLRAAYAMGQHDGLKVLLRQKNPATLARVMAYHRYVTSVRAGHIKETMTRLARLRTLARQLEKESAALEALRSEQLQTQRHLEAQRSSRQAILSQLRAKIRQDGDHIAQLDRDKDRLEELLAGIREALKLSDIPDTLDSGTPFASLKGKLQWPSRGSIVHPFGSPRQPGAISWKGVWIASPRDQPVRAVWHGRIAFADWLRGFGLLLIIDHGGGYMSLYGHNQSLYKEVGDWVQAGDLIATVGDSGGSPEPGLYFEIRHKGTPKDPSDWCKGALTAGH